MVLDTRKLYLVIKSGCGFIFGSLQDFITKYVIEKCVSYFITKCDKVILQKSSTFLSQNATVLLQNATVITKCNTFVTKCDSYYKMWRIFQFASVHTCN